MNDVILPMQPRICEGFLKSSLTYALIAVPLSAGNQ